MNDDTNLFEYATRKKLRFTSSKGELTAEQLWDAPLRSTDGFNLDVIAKTAHKALKDATEESFVATTRPTSTKLEMTLAVVKRVIEVKLAEEAEKERQAENKKEREKITEILARKQEEKLAELPEKVLQKRLDALK